MKKMRFNPPFFYGWIILGICFLAEFSLGMGSVTIGLFFKPISDTFGWSLTELTGAVTAQGLLALAISPLVGILLDRFGPRPVMLFGALTAGFGFILLMQIEHIWQFWVLYAVVGAMGLGELGGITAPVAVAKWFIRMRGRAMAVTTSGVTIGGAVFSPLVGFLIASVGWRNTWGIMGIGLLIVMVPIVGLFMRRQPEDLGLLPDGDSRVVENGSQEAIKNTNSFSEVPSWTLKSAFRNRTFWILILVLNLAHFTGPVSTLHVVPFFTLQKGLSAQFAGQILALRLMASTLGRIMWGFLVDRISTQLCLILLLAARSMGIIFLVIAPYPFNAVLFLVSTGFFGGPLSFLQPMILSNYYGRRYIGSIQGAVRPFLAVSQLAGPLFIAVLFDSTGSFDFAFVLAGGLGLLAAFGAIFATPPKWKLSSEENQIPNLND